MPTTTKAKRPQKKGHKPIGAVVPIAHYNAFKADANSRGFSVSGWLRCILKKTFERKA